MELFEQGLPAVHILCFSLPMTRNINFQTGRFAAFEQLKLISILETLGKSRLTLLFYIY